jgi:hypothetical protein
MNQKSDGVEIKFSQENQSQNAPTPEASEASEAGLTDDERVIREEEFIGNEARVEPGPADFDQI